MVKFRINKNQTARLLTRTANSTLGNQSENYSGGLYHNESISDVKPEQQQAPQQLQLSAPQIFQRNTIQKPKKKKYRYWKRCSQCGHSMKDSNWYIHWKTVHQIYNRRRMTEIKHGMLPEHPHWLAEAEFDTSIQKNQIWTLDQHSSEGKMQHDYVESVIKRLKSREMIPYAEKLWAFAAIHQCGIVVDEIWPQPETVRHVKILKGDNRNPYAKLESYLPIIQAFQSKIKTDDSQDLKELLKIAPRPLRARRELIRRQ